jgi:IS5 family transposase
MKWFGYKIHAGIDMAHGLISRVAATPANVEDNAGARHVLPRQGMVFADKAYSVGGAQREMRRRGLHSGAILRNQMKAKNPDKDRWLAGVRMPYESTFARFEKRARYRGLAKCQFQAFMQAFSHNFKRLLAIGAAPLILRPDCA